MLSELELVAQAMGTSSASQPQANGNPPAINGNSSNASNTSALPADIAASLSDLSGPDLAALQPLLAALTANGASGLDLENMSDKDIEDLMGQMDAAGDVADTLEGRLDKLLETLGQVEQGMGEDGEEVAQGGLGGEEQVQGMVDEAQKAFEEVAEKKDEEGNPKGE